jgi:hypothetical protein
MAPRRTRVECEHPRLAEFVLPFRGLQVYRQLKGSGLQELVRVYPRWISRGERVGLVLLIFTVLISNPDFSPPREHGNRLCLSSQLRRVLRLIHCLNPAYKRLEVAEAFSKAHSPGGVRW